MPSTDYRQCGMLGLCMIACPMSNRLDQMAKWPCARRLDLSEEVDEPLEIVLGSDDESMPGQEEQEQERS